MKIFFTSFIFLISNLCSAQEGDFKINNSDFKNLFNNYRVAQPDPTPWSGSYFPYGEDGTAAKVEDHSPMNVYDILAGLNSKNGAYAWEKENHTCDFLSGKEKLSCEDWWGHCNGWAGAAIKEIEPNKSIKIGPQNITVGDQKGIFTELWLSSYALFSGDTEKSKETGKWIFNPNDPSNKSFWDVTPKNFFLLFTNYIGIQKSGLVIDRFTGDQVWNQPVVGYRILPIRKNDIKEITKDGKAIYSVSFRMKIYWANDSGTPANHISAKLNIQKDTNDDEDIEVLPHSVKDLVDYDGRVLKFKLYFDEKVETSNNGTKITSAGKIIGDGIWFHQEYADQFSFDDLNNSHPDFIWLPTNPLIDSTGYGNPFLSIKTVSDLRTKIHKGGDSETSPNDENKASQIKYIISFRLSSFPKEATEKNIRNEIKKILIREGIKSVIRSDGIETTSTLAKVTILFPQGESAESLKTLFTDADLKITSIKTIEDN